MPFIAPVIGAIAGAIGAIGSFTIGGLAVGQMLLGIGLNVSSMLIQKALAKKPKGPPGGVQFERQYGADVPRHVACGLVGIAGHDCYINTYGSSNKYLQQVYTISDYPCDGLTRVAINGKWATLGAEDPQKGRVVATGEFANLIWIKFIDGRQTAADPYLVGNANPASRWTEDHIGVGEAAILVSMTFDQEKNNQFPDFFFEFRGAPLYDWRKDSSVGGSGPHRWNDPSTHEFSENPVVIEYNYRRGFSVNGDLFCGMDMPASDLPLDKWTAAANLCDENVSGEARYRCSILLDCMSTHGPNIESIALSCGAMTVDGVEGSWPIVGSDQPTVVTFTDDDLITTAQVRYRAKRSQSELVNSVSGNFPDPDNLWSMVGYEPQVSAAHVALDRRTRDLAIDFPQVRSSRQAAQLASIYLYENRYEATATVTLRPRFQVLEPGDWVRWNSKRYGDKVYIVTETQLMSLDSEGPRNIQLSLQERDGAIYDAVSPPPIVVPAPPGMPVYLNEVQDFALAPVSISGADGRLAPAIRASWSAITDETVTAVEVHYYPTAQPSAVIVKTVQVPTTVTLLAEGVISGTEYTVKTKLVTDPARVTALSAGKTVETDTIASDVDVYLENVKGDLRETLMRQQREMNELRDRLEILAAGTADATGASSEMHTVTRKFRNATAIALREMTASIEAKTQVYRQPTPPTGDLVDGDIWIDTSADNFVRVWNAALEQWEDAGAKGLLTFAQPTAPIASNVGDLWIDTDDDNKLYRWSGTAWVDISDERITAQASILDAVQARVGEISADGLRKIEVMAGTGDVVARLVDMVRATIGDDWVEAGTIIEVGFTGGDPAQPFSNYILMGERIMFMTATGEVYGLFGPDGLTIQNARLGTLKFDRLESNNGKLVLHGAGASPYISVKV
ncbi:phage tail protein [Aquamicrobium defluvii]|uniref:Tip attachment protein J domain-containing protein n=1 Tax=Aquamicrobium defluvii TaxID=69279 RepID=A0A011UQW0_9HYPH|nr:phage tail protein [Aquamicrobium defluvii]EXL08606.1 hypothetical protein BG36_03455 [Aquamicrobium defluvii]EZQ14882.1 hypothetical protein CF98_14945 [Halopseudomonas bauzanensis]